MLALWLHVFFFFFSFLFIFQRLFWVYSVCFSLITAYRPIILDHLAYGIKLYNAVLLPPASGPVGLGCVCSTLLDVSLLRLNLVFVPKL